MIIELGLENMNAESRTRKKPLGEAACVNFCLVGGGFSFVIAKDQVPRNSDTGEVVIAAAVSGNHDVFVNNASHESKDRCCNK